jgi:hypothetical protein
MKNILKKKNPIRSIRRKIKEYLFYKDKRPVFEVDVNGIYDDSEFRGRDRQVYREYAEALEEVFALKEVIDIGCANGYLLEALYKNGIRRFAGLEGADAAFKYMADEVKKNAFKTDLSKEVNVLTGERFYLVNCTEVGEHIPAKYEEVFLRNIEKFVGKYLVLSWADTWEDWLGFDKQKHVNPRSKRYVKNRLQKLGLSYNRSLTDKLVNTLKNKQNVFEHWARNMMVFEKI